MTDQRESTRSYEAPRIEERTEIALPLVLAVASENADGSAVFRSI